MKITRRQLRRIINESLPPWMIDAIRRREEREYREKEHGRRLPLHIPSPPPPETIEDEDEDPVGSSIVDYQLEGRLAKLTRGQLSEMIRDVLKTINSTSHVNK